jgi:hypothetical protein
MVTWPLLYPLANQRCLMGAIVVQYQMDIEIDGNGVVDSPQG